MFSLVEHSSKSLLATASRESPNQNSVGAEKAKSEIVSGIREVKKEVVVNPEHYNKKIKNTVIGKGKGNCRTSRWHMSIDEWSG